MELRVGDHLGRSEELVSRCVECDLAEPESLASLGGSAPGVVDGILSDLIGRTFLLPPEENGERHRAKVTRKVVEIIDQEDGQRVENINFILDIGNGKVEELVSYNQLLEHLENAQDHDMGMDQELYKFRAIIGHQGPLLASDPDWKGSKYNVQVEWETGEITFEPLSIIAADDPVTCAAYAKENDLLALEGWRRFRSLAKKDKVLARAIKQSKIR